MLTFVEEVLPTPAGTIPKLIVSEAKNFPELARFFHDEVVSRVRSHLVEVIQRGVAAGRFRLVDPELVFVSLVSPMLLAALWGHTFEPYDTRRLDVPAMIESHLDLMFRGLLPGADRLAAKPGRGRRSRPPGSRSLSTKP